MEITTIPTIQYRYTEGVIFIDLETTDRWDPSCHVNLFAQFAAYYIAVGETEFLKEAKLCLKPVIKQIATSMPLAHKQWLTVDPYECMRSVLSSRSFKSNCNRAFLALPSKAMFPSDKAGWEAPYLPEIFFRSPSDIRPFLSMIYAEYGRDQLMYWLARMDALKVNFADNVIVVYDMCSTSFLAEARFPFPSRLVPKPTIDANRKIIPDLPAGISINRHKGKIGTPRREDNIDEI